MSTEEKTDLSAMIAEVMKNPEVSRMVAELKANMTENSAGENAAPAAAAPSGTVPPEVLAKLPEMMAVLGKGGGKPSPASRDAENRRRLLAALKPYLNPARKDAVESILRVTEITDLLGTIPQSTRGGDG